MLLLLAGFTAGILFGTDEQIRVISQDYSSFHRVKISGPDGGPAEFLPLPDIRETPEDGQFEILFSPVDTNQFRGQSISRDWGNVPLQLIITFPDSNTMKIAGTTIPYSESRCFHTVRENIYYFDIYPDSADESTFREMTLGYNAEVHPLPDSKASDTLPPVRTFMATAHSGQTESGFSARILKALGYALLVTVLLAAFFFVFVFRRKLDQYFRKLSHRTQLKTGGRESTSALQHTPLTPEAREQQIKEIMESRDVSWDEANIIISMNERKLNVKA